MFRPLFRNVTSSSHFSKPWSVLDDGVVKLESLTKESLSGAMKLIRESFLVEENLCKAVSLLEESGAGEELMKTCYDTVRDGVSLIAHDPSTNEIVGVILNKIMVRMPKSESYYEKFSENCKFKASKAIIDFAIDMDNRADLFNRYNSNCLLEIMYIAAMPEYRQKKIGERLVIATVKLAEELNDGKEVKTLVDVNGAKQITNVEAIPSLISALATSNYSQRITAKIGFDKVVEVNYDDLTFKGRKFSEKIGDEHKTCQVLAKRIRSK